MKVCLKGFKDMSGATSESLMMNKVETVVEAVNVRVTAAIDQQLKRLDSLCEKLPINELPTTQQDHRNNVELHRSTRT